MIVSRCSSAREALYKLVLDASFIASYVPKVSYIYLSVKNKVKHNTSAIYLAFMIFGERSLVKRLCLLDYRDTPDVGALSAPRSDGSSLSLAVAA